MNYRFSRFCRRGLVGAAVTLSAAIAPLLSMPTAAAASTPAGACGSGFREIDHHDLPNATIYLLYNDNDNCVVTWKTKYLGTASETNASIELAGQRSTAVSDSGKYKYYAGPVKIAAKGKCIQWEGEAQPPGTVATIENYWKSQASHCG
ncbi:hypothetical protein [Nocardia sp. AB354]|uniref:hypothetical protein n=1 Tax=Nocardia sp. AB354 TaxID=3413283 RepID=UPI003C1E7F74